MLKYARDIAPGDVIIVTVGDNEQLYLILSASLLEDSRSVRIDFVRDSGLVIDGKNGVTHPRLW